MVIRSFAGGLLMVASSIANAELRVVDVDADVVVEVEGRYVVHVPDGYDDGVDETWPLLLFLHGSGERGTDLGLLSVHGPLREVEEGRSLPFIVVAPQCPDDERWPLALLEAVYQDVTSTYRIDRDRIYLTGLSMGGQGVWKFATAHPNRFAALAPICGRSYPERADAIAGIPTWVFHGAADAVVPVEESNAMVEALRAAGGSPRYTTYPEGTHDVWTATYDNAELYEWLLGHRRTTTIADRTKS